MEKSDNAHLPYHSELKKYVPKDLNEPNSVYKKIKVMRTVLFFAAIAHITTAAVLMILLLVSLIAKAKIGFELSQNWKIFSFSYVSAVIILNLVGFVLPSKKFKKKLYFRVLAVSTPIISTLILSGSFFFWSIPVLLFFGFVTLLIWIAEVYITFLLISIVELLPN